MDVLGTLEKHNISRKEFLFRFGITTRTLDDYHNKLLKDKELPRWNYNIAFKGLFDRPLSHDLFMYAYDLIIHNLKLTKVDLEYAVNRVNKLHDLNTFLKEAPLTKTHNNFVNSINEHVKKLIVGGNKWK